MFKSLVLLAVSMTGTTIVLSQLEPAASPHYPFPAQIQQFVRSAIASAEPIVPESWSGVEIVLEREVVAYRRNTLVAVPDTDNYHFRVGSRGEVSPSVAWREQRSASADGAIRIMLANQKTDSATAQVQWAALRMLLVELRGLLEAGVAPEGMAWQVTLSDQAAGDNALQTHLRSAGLLG